MKLRARFFIGWMAAWMVVVLAGCSAGSAAGDSAAATDSVSAEASMADNGYGMSGGTPAEDAGSGVQERKMIHRAELELETTQFDQAVEELAAMTEQLGGYYESSSVGDRGSGYRWADYVVRVPAAQYPTFLDQAGELCHETWRNTWQDDITQTYYDTQGRLKTQQIKLQRLQALLEEAERMEDIITIESAISETEEQIDQLSGSLQHYDAQVDYASVSISLREVYQLSSVQDAPVGFGERLADAFAGGWRGFVSGMEGLLVALAYGWIWILLLVIAAVVLLRITRHRRIHLPGPGKPDDKPPKT